MNRLFVFFLDRIPIYWRILLKKIKQDGMIHALWACCKWVYQRRHFIKFEKVIILKSIPLSDEFERGNSPCIVVQIHCFYPEELPELLSYINRIPYRFDCFVSTDTEEKKSLIERTLISQSRAVNNFVQCFPNRGRDVAPMLLQLPGEVLQRYNYLLHIHSKKSSHGDFGGDWMMHLLTTLLYSPGYIAAILDRMKRGNYGMVFQSTYCMVKPALGWHGNRENCARYLDRIGISADLPDSPVFPAGNMFWAKTDAILPVFNYGFTSEDFPPERGQVEGTLAHCVERCWGIVVKSQGYRCLRVKPNLINKDLLGIKERE